MVSLRNPLEAEEFTPSSPVTAAYVEVRPRKMDQLCTAGEKNGVPRNLWFYSPMGRSQWSQSAHRRKTSAIAVRASERFVLGSKILVCLLNLRWVNFGVAQESSIARLFQTAPLPWVWSF